MKQSQIRPHVFLSKVMMIVMMLGVNFFQLFDAALMTGLCLLKFIEVAVYFS